MDTKSIYINKLAATINNDTVKQSFYDPTSHIGTQPIRVLTGNILHWFENAEQNFKQDLIREVTFSGLQKSIHYINEETKISDVAYVDGNKQIAIQETFLSFLWSISYGLVVIFDEVIMRPRVEENYVRTQADIDRVNKAKELFDYGLSLLDNFNKWDINSLPNPEYYDPNDNAYIEKINAVFLAAVNFVLVHEFGHVYLGHIDLHNLLYQQGQQPTKDEILKGEFAADEYSFKTLMDGADFIANKQTVSAGIIAGLCALLFFDRSLDGDDHPDPDYRIKRALDKLNLDEKDNLWGIAALAFKLWADKYKIDLGWPPIVDTYKELFDLTIEKLKTHGHRNGSS
jgi:hypothetical protein